MSLQNSIFNSGSDGTTNTTLSTKELRKRLRRRIRDALKSEGNDVIEAPTSVGKSYSVSTTQWRELSQVTGGEPVIHLSVTKKARNEAKKKSEQADGVKSHTLLGGADACPLYRGDYDSDNEKGNDPIRAPDGTEPSEWFKTRCQTQGWPLTSAHPEFRRQHTGDLPCGSSCDALTQWTGIPRNEDGNVQYDVIHGTHQMGRVPGLIEDCNIFIDELPNFSESTDTGVIRKSVTPYLEEVSEVLPLSKPTWENLITWVDIVAKQDRQEVADRLETPGPDWFREEDDAHALAPGIVEAILRSEEQCHDRRRGIVRCEYPDFPSNANAPNYEVIIGLVYDERNNIKLLQVVPDFSEARCVIGLDAHPTEPKWRANTLGQMEFDAIVGPDERQEWRCKIRELEIVQVGTQKYSWTKNGFNDDKVRALCEELRHEYGDAFASGITSKQFENDLQDCMEDVGIEEPTTEYHGNLKSIEKFADESVGLVAGCISPSSDSIKDWLALLGKEATPKREVVEEYDGQDWVGPDADVAMELLRDVREKGVLQACGRYARNADDPDSGAIVYVLTSQVPNTYVDRHVADIELLGEKGRNILRHARNRDWVSAYELANLDTIESSKKHIHTILEECADYDWLSIEENSDRPHNRNIFSADRVPLGIVEV